MIPLTITMNLDLDPWIDLATQGKEVEHGRILRVGVLPNATGEGRAAVELLIEADDGRLIVAETTLRLFNAAARAVAACPVAQMDHL